MSACLDVAPGVEEEVLGLEVPVDNAAAVQVVDGVDDAGHVEARCEVVEPAAVAQDRPQLPAQARLHQQIHVPAVKLMSVFASSTKFDSLSSNQWCQDDSLTFCP